jgi:hypothetical protein
MSKPVEQLRLLELAANAEAMYRHASGLTPIPELALLLKAIGKLPEEVEMYRKALERRLR